MGFRTSVQRHMKSLCSSASCLWWWPTIDPQGVVWSSTSIQGGIFSLSSGNSPAFSNLWLWDILRVWYHWHLRKGDILEAHRYHSGTSPHYWSAHSFLLPLATFLPQVRVTCPPALLPPFPKLLDLLEQSWQVTLTYCMLGIHCVLLSLSSSSTEIRYLKADHLPQ